MSSNRAFPIYPVPDVAHERECIHCHSTWLCECKGVSYNGGRNFSKHDFTIEGANYCPLCREECVCQNRRLANRDPAYEPDDVHDAGVQPEPRGQGLSDWMKRS